MCAKRRIALYGGTFDPVHLGHLEVARRVLQLFEIEKVLFVPAQIAPHKIGRTVTLPIHRYAMLALATQHDPGLVVSTFELEDADRRFTVDTLAHFQAEFEGCELFFIMGADSWNEVTTWREWERLLGMVNHIVVTRPGYEIDIDHVGPDLGSRVVDLRQVNSVVSAMGKDARIYVTDAAMKDIAATDIRRAARKGEFEKLNTYVPDAVAEYIVKYRIYQGSNETQYC
jgi:nicotinate-nucleotide adenylyltransferase